MTRILRVMIWAASVAAIVAASTLGIRTALSTQAPSPVEADVLGLVGRLGHPEPLYVEPAEPHPTSVMPGLPIEDAPALPEQAPMPPEQVPAPGPLRDDAPAPEAPSPAPSGAP